MTGDSFVLAFTYCITAVVFIGILLFAVSYGVYTGAIKANFEWFPVFHTTDKLYRRIKLFGSQRCPYCRSRVVQTDHLVACDACKTIYHSDCWTGRGGCSLYGCVGKGCRTSSGQDIACSHPISIRRLKEHLWNFLKGHRYEQVLFGLLS